jgi:hypothetical protein
METDALLEEILGTDAATDLVIDPDDDEPTTVRVLWSAPYEGVSMETGAYVNTAPQVQGRRTDFADIAPEQTVVEVEGARYVVQRNERVEGAGDHWRNLVLRKAVG